ncbi:MAG: hypothetical protein AB1611_05220 [bacterium]
MIPFLEYAVQGFIDGLKEQINLIRFEQFKIIWRNFIYDIFKNRDGLVNDRRRKLMLDISDRFDPIPLKEIRYISPRIAEIYAKKTDKTIGRDINELVSMGLLKRVKEGYTPCRELISAFLPERRTQ